MVNGRGMRRINPIGQNSQSESSNEMNEENLVQHVNS